MTTVGEVPFVLGTPVLDCWAAPVTATPKPPTTLKPSASNTGPTTGSGYLRETGDIVVREAGAVIDSVRVNGTLRVEAPGVVVKNSYIAGRAGLPTGTPLVYVGTSSSGGFRIENSEIAPSDRSWILNGIYGYGFTATAVDVHHVIDSIHIFGDDVTVRHSWLHDNYHGPDANQPDGVTHDDNVQVQVGKRIQLIGNTMSGAHNAALQITQDRGSVADLTLSDNWISGGGCSLNIAEKSGGVIRGLAIMGNRLGQSRFNCPVILSPGVMAISTITTNTWEDTGKPIYMTCREPSRANWRC